MSSERALRTDMIKGRQDDGQPCPPQRRARGGPAGAAVLPEGLLWGLVRGNTQDIGKKTLAVCAQAKRLQG